MVRAYPNKDEKKKPHTTNRPQTTKEYKFDRMQNTHSGRILNTICHSLSRKKTLLFADCRTARHETQPKQNKK